MSPIQQLSPTEVHLLQRQKCYISFSIQKLSTNSTEAKGRRQERRKKQSFFFSCRGETKIKHLTDQTQRLKGNYESKFAIWLSV